MEIPEVVILRLPLYLRALTEISRDGTLVVSSQELGEYLQITSAQIRKDLSYFGRFGRQGRGYDVDYLTGELKQILGLDREWRACLIGVGRLGRAIIQYPGFSPEGFRIVAVFDANPKLLGKGLNRSLKIQPMSALCDTVSKSHITIGIVAVPASHAQEVINNLVVCGVKAILNYAPVGVQVPPDVKLRSIDPVLSLQSMTYYLRTLEESEDGSAGRRRRPRRGQRRSKAKG